MLQGQFARLSMSTAVSCMSTTAQRQNRDGSSRCKLLPVLRVLPMISWLN